MNQKGLAVIRSLVGRFGTEWLSFVVSATDAGVRDDSYSAIVELCSRFRIPLIDRRREPPPADWLMAVGWRWMIRRSYPLIVLHDSLLPRYRGFAPLVSMLINGETSLGVTALFASEQYDRGPIIMQQSVAVQYPIKIQRAIDLIIPLYVDIAGELLQRILSGAAMEGSEQRESEATYSLWRDEQDYLIDWNWSAERIQRFVDAVGAPYEGARTYAGEEQIVVHDVEVAPDVRIENRTPGKVIFVEGHAPVVVCGSGLVRLTAMSTLAGDPFTLPSFRTRFQSHACPV